MNFAGKSAFVTGGCGFIGSHLVESLVKAGAKTKALAFYDARGSFGWLDSLPPEIKKEVEIIAGDIRDGDMMTRAASSGDIIFHLAALIGIPYSYHSPRSYVDTNITGTLNMLEAARNKKASRILVTSTSEVYGTALRVPIDEGHPLQGQSPYSASKIGAEKMAESYYKSFELPVVVVRPFNTYGPRQSARAVIPTVLSQMLKGRTVISLGDADTTRDFNFVADTVEGMMRLADCDAASGTAVNIGTGVDFPIRDVVEKAANALGVKVEIKTDKKRLRPAASEVRRLQADNSLLKKLTGWTPPPRLDEGLSITAEWLKPGIDGFDPDRYYV